LKNSADPKELYAKLVKELVKNPKVELPIGKRGFGSSGLYTDHKLFCFLSHKNCLILKLPQKRVDELVSSGDGTHWDPRGDGRGLKEWLELKPSSKLKWLLLAKEGLRFVGHSDDLVRKPRAVRGEED
jgi:hypothetical protein